MRSENSTKTTRDKTALTSFLLENRELENLTSCELHDVLYTLTRLIQAVLSALGTRSQKGI